MKKECRVFTASKFLIAVWVYTILTLCTCIGYSAGVSLKLPIQMNPLAAGYADYYVIRADGTLIHSSEYGLGFNHTRELLSNTAAVYTDGRTLLAVDQDGTLWSFNMVKWLHGIRPDVPWDYDIDKDGPIKVMEDVSMAAVDNSHLVALKRDGTVWVAGTDFYGAPWLSDEQHPHGSYFVQIMDNVIWVDAAYYGGYAVTADHELWGWGISKDSTGPEKLADGIVQVSGANTAITEQGELLNWTCTEVDGKIVRTQPKAILNNTAKCGKGFILKTDGTIWASGADWGREGDLWYDQNRPYGTHLGPYDPTWDIITDDGASLQKLPVENAMYAATGDGGMIVLDTDGTLWGIFDINTANGNSFHPIQPLCLGSGYFGAKWNGKDGMENFSAVRQYQQGIFSDVKQNDWYAPNVKAAYELGLMQGNNGAFNPTGNIKLCEAITIAARVRAAYRGDTIEHATTGPWYQPYVDYALAARIQTSRISDYNRPATRAELAILLVSALPEEEFPDINGGIVFSDMEETHPAFSAALTMARAGIIQGRGNGRFEPEATIMRCEAAAMLSRCAWPELRIRSN